MKISGKVTGKQVALHTILRTTRFFSTVIFPYNVRPRDDQMFKRVCTSHVILGKFSLKSKLLSKLLIGILTPRYLTRF